MHDDVCCREQLERFAKLDVAADQCPHLPPRGAELAHEMLPDKPARAGDRHDHGRSLPSQIDAG
jgi:hypothetical protein